MRLRGWLFAALLLASPLAQAQTPPSPIVTATLAVDAPSITTGKPIAAAVTFTMPEHWHIYWKNPGDSGLETKLDWTLPDGLTAGSIEWPAPERIEVQGLINYGYSNSITLPVSLTPSKDGIRGDVKVKASWLVCKDICIPESAELSAPLQADAAATQSIADARARVPMAFNGTANFTPTVENITLTLERMNPWGAITNVWFAPAEDGLMTNNPIGDVKIVGNELTLTFPRGTADAINEWHGVLNITQDGEPLAYDITASNTVPVATPLAAAPAMAPQTPPTFLIALALAFLGGLILNIMPCVLPILALKALALSKKSQASRKAAITQGISYTAGVVLSFLLIAGVMIALKATGSAIGWGFQLQNPAFVGFLALVMVLVSANLLGAFELPVLFGTQATGVDETKARGSFLTGVLAVLVATPCTAPFMATAIGATLSYPAPQALLVFAVLGLGMAAPFLLISVWPAARRLLPKPGAWMHRFKQILAIPMLATAAWLIFVLVQLLNPSPMKTEHGQIPYSKMVLEQMRAEGKPVLLDATAAWCLTCKVNERVALEPESTQHLFREKNIAWMVADWTSNDPAITELLASFGRNGVPLYVYYPPHGTPVVLPQVLTTTIVRDAVTKP